MTNHNLTSRERVGVRSVQALAHSAGYDPKVITRMAWDNMQSGMQPRAAHEAALRHFLNHTAPDLKPAALKITRLVNHSDDQTIATYDSALDRYNQTGDQSHIDALAPMIAKDSVQLAVKLGEITVEEATSGNGLETALGYEPSDHMQAALQQAVAAPASPPQKFEFAPRIAMTHVTQQPAQTAPQGQDGPFNLGETMRSSTAHSWINGNQSGPGPRRDQTAPAMESMAHYTAPQRTATGGIRAGMSADRARAWAGTPVAAEAPAQ